MVTIRNVNSTPFLEPLFSIGHDLRIQLKIIGSVARRIAILDKRIRNGDASCDRSHDLLFTLVPFTSDIDIVHSGARELNGVILRRIHDAIAFSEYFRWQIRSSDENEVYWQAVKVSNIVPVNLMSFDETGIRDRWDGLRDIENDDYRYIRNGFFSTSPLYKREQDLEVFSTLLYYKALGEARFEEAKLKNMKGLETARSVIESTAKDAMAGMMLQSSSYLRMRLRYLFQSLRATLLLNLPESSLEDHLRLRTLIGFVRENHVPLADHLESILESKERVEVVSANLGGDLFRLPSCSDWHGENEAVNEWNSLSNVVLGSGQVILLASPELTVHVGTSASSGPPISGLSRPGSGQREFLHFSVSLRPEDASRMDQFLERNIACILAIKARKPDATESENITIPVPTSCEMAHSWKSHRLLIRLNCWGIFSKLSEIADELSSRSKPSVQIFVVGWKGLQ